MKRRLLLRGIVTSTLLALLGACASTPSRGPERDPRTVRVMTWNIFAGNDLERRSNLERVGALIDSVDADVVFLQEVDRRTARSGNVDQATTIAERAGMHVVFGPAMQYDGGEFGNAILTRWPAQSSRVVPLEVSPPRELAGRSFEARSLLHVVVATPFGTAHLIGTHLDHQPESIFRNAQMLQLLAYLAQNVPRGEPIILGGDLNAPPDAPEARALMLPFQDAWQECGAGDGLTFRADRPERRIDYILLAGAQCTNARVPASRLSDHRPVIVDVRLERR